MANYNPAAVQSALATTSASNPAPLPANQHITQVSSSTSSPDAISQQRIQMRRRVKYECIAHHKSEAGTNQPTSVNLAEVINTADGKPSLAETVVHLECTGEALGQAREVEQTEELVQGEILDGGVPEHHEELDNPDGDVEHYEEVVYTRR